MELPARQVVPPALHAHLDHVAGELLVLGTQTLELGLVGDAPAVRVAELLAVDVRHVPHVGAPTDRAVVGRRIPHVPARPDQVGVGVTHVESGEPATAVVTQDRSSGECVVGVPPHGGECNWRGHRLPSPPDLPVCAPAGHQLYARADISKRYIGALEPPCNLESPSRPETLPVLDLAVLGLLKEQPLHGYELKKRLGETLGSLWGISYGSLYPALRRLERDGAIESVGPEQAPSIPATGSLKGDLAAARLRRTTKPTRRTRKAYRLTAHGDARLNELLLADDPSADDERGFALKLAFCGHLDPDARLRMLERRRVTLADRLIRTQRPGSGRGDRYTRSLLEHRTQSTQRDLEWIDALIDAERTPSQQPHPHAEGATA